MPTYSIIQKSQLEGALRLDAEYYQPLFLENAKKIERFGFLELSNFSTIDITKGETPLWRGDGYVEKGIPFLRSENLLPVGIDLSSIVFITEKVNDRMLRSKIYPDDVLLAIVGATIGQIGRATDKYKEYNTNQAIAIIRPKDVKYSSYLSIILETKFCQIQISRLKGGGARDNLDLHEVKILKIPKPNEEILNFCFQTVKKIEELYKDGEEGYRQAEDLLLEELGLKDFKMEEKLSCVVNLSDAKSVNRFDAEYFNSEVNRIIEKVSKSNPVLLGDLLVDMQKGIEIGAEAYQEQGKLFVRVSSITSQEIIDKDQKYLSDELYQKYKKDYQPQLGEILLTKDATPGTSYVIKEPIEGIICGGIMRLRAKKNIEPEYLSFCINSIIGKLQVERDAGGSIIAHWKPEQIKNLQIPILPKSIQQKIADLVRQSHTARQKAKQLLDEAKRKIEEMIEAKN